MEPKITGYVTAYAGLLTNASHDVIFMATPGLGGKIEKNGFYAQAEAGYRTNSESAGNCIFSLINLPVCIIK